MIPSHPDLDLVTIPKQEYLKLLEYKQICREAYALMKDNKGDGL